MLRAAVPTLILVLLAACGKRPPPVPDLSWRGKPELMAEFSNRLNYANVYHPAAIRGRILVIDLTTPPPVFEDYLNRMLPEELRPRTREEVGTLVWIVHSRARVTQYSSGAPGYQEVYEVTLVDVAAKEAFHTAVFRGGMPDAEYKVRASDADRVRREGHSGGDPSQAVLDFLKSLPRS